jgi:hypothetical protein
MLTRTVASLSNNICKATAHRLRPIAALHTGCCERAFTHNIRGTTLPRPGARDLRSSPIHCMPAKSMSLYLVRSYLIGSHLTPESLVTSHQYT